MNKIAKRILIGAIIICLLLLSGGIYAGNMLYNLALNSETDKSFILDAPHNSGDGDDGGAKEKDWFKESEYTNEYLISEDGLKLHAYMVKNSKQTNNWVIMSHGYSSEANNMYAEALQFLTMGFNVLLPDARGHGLSEGDYIGMGWPERRDIVNWAQTIAVADANAKIVLYGVSMGAATVMMASGEADLPNNVKVVVEDCGYATVWEEFSYQLDELFNLPAFPFLNFASLVTKIRAGYWIGDANALEQISKTDLPMLMIHGTADTFVPYEMVDTIYDTANGPKEKLVVEGAKHAESAKVLGDAYWEAVQTFIFEYL